MFQRQTFLSIAYKNILSNIFFTHSKKYVNKKGKLTFFFPLYILRMEGILRIF